MDREWVARYCMINRRYIHSWMIDDREYIEGRFMLDG